MVRYASAAAAVAVALFQGLDKLPADVADEVRASAQEAAAHGSAATFALIGATGLLAWRHPRRAE